MEKRRISGTDLDVSVICLGTMTFGTPVGEKEAISLVRHAFDSGINFFDTANMYEGYTRFSGSPGGVAEEYLGKALKGIRKEAVIATKVGMKVGNCPEDEFTSPAAISKHLDKSLLRLGTDMIDIYYLHKYDPNTRPEDIILALEKAMREGKIRHYGVSNHTDRQLETLLETARENNMPGPVICQPPLSMLKQDSLADMIPFCDKRGISVAPFQVLQGGLLTGKYERGEPVPAGSRKEEMSGWVWELNDGIYDKLDKIKNDAKKNGMSMTHYAIQWVLKQPAVVSAIIGVKKKEQIDDAVKGGSYV